MHIMVNKRYMWKLDTCAGHEALIIKLLVKKPPGIMSVGSASSVCEQSSDKENFYKQLFPKKYNAWLSRTQVKNLKL